MGIASLAAPSAARSSATEAATSKIASTATELASKKREQRGINERDCEISRMNRQPHGVGFSAQGTLEHCIQPMRLERLTRVASSNVEENPAGRSPEAQTRLHWGARPLRRDVVPSSLRTYARWFTVLANEVIGGDAFVTLANFRSANLFRRILAIVVNALLAGKTSDSSTILRVLLAP